MVLTVPVFPVKHKRSLPPPTRTLKSGKPRPPKRPFLDLGEEEAKREEQRRKLEKQEEEKEKQLAEGERKEDNEEELVKGPSNPTIPQLLTSTFTHNSIPSYKDAVMIRDLSLTSLLLMPRPLLVPDFPDTPWQSTVSHSVVPRRQSTPSQSVGPRPPMHPRGPRRPWELRRPRRGPSEPSSTVTEPDSDPDDSDSDELPESPAPPYAEKRGRLDNPGLQDVTPRPIPKRVDEIHRLFARRAQTRRPAGRDPVVFPAYRPRRLYEMVHDPFFYQSKKTGNFKTGHDMSLKGRGSVGVGREISVSKHRWVQHKGYRAVTKWTQKDREDCLEDDCQHVIDVKRGPRPLKEYLWMDSSEKPLGRQVEVSTERGAEHRLEVWVPVVTRRLMEAMVALWTFLVWDLALGRGAETPGSSLALRLC
ncbi:hypothetical protein B0T18DRAFT_391425 [Schizothecium vesticola]|uniref:Uncharacterized protein n=1 Tax=Schizothecium vesticola TaxID=314040 RepID=A0AA40EXF2_9PEZI|nr:hypothetical protein B0T18DRAFT_391425 [Schizothecium vesticola]